jgi:hypothetical protein
VTFDAAAFSVNGISMQKNLLRFAEANGSKSAVGALYKDCSNRLTTVLFGEVKYLHETEIIPFECALICHVVVVNGRSDNRLLAVEGADLEYCCKSDPD